MVVMPSLRMGDDMPVPVTHPPLPAHVFGRADLTRPYLLVRLCGSKCELRFSLALWETKAIARQQPPAGGPRLGRHIKRVALL